jgi:serine/threonine-protein kinase HipA
MAKNIFMQLQAFGMEIGRIGFDEDRNTSSFQYNPEFLKDGHYMNLFPLVFRKQSQTQAFDKFGGETFRGLPPMIADSLPDMFGNLVFKTWLEKNNKSFDQLSVLEQKQ